MNHNVLFYENRLNGCNFYRIRQVARKLMEIDFPCALSKQFDKEDELQTWVDKAGCIYSQMLENEKFLDWMLDEQKAGRKLIFDYDDDPFNVSPFNPSYEKRGLKEVQFHKDDGSLLGEWKDGVDGFSIQDNLKRLQTFARALHQADMVTTTTLPLKDVFSRYSYRVKQIRNMVDLKIWNPLPLIKTDKVRIVYQGGWSHYKDFMEVKKALEIVMREYKNTVLVIMGQWYPGILENIPEDRIELHDWVDVELYPWVFKTLNADIGICPLENITFNVGKSEIKWVEYGSLEIPAVCSKVRPYIVAVDDGKTGFLAKDTDEWIENLSKLIESKVLRQEIGKEARKRIVENYDINKHINIYKNAIMSCFGRDLVGINDLVGIKRR